MIESGEELRLAPEAGDALGIERDGGGQDLQRDVAPELRIVGAIDLSHSSSAEQRSHLVGAESVAGVQGHASRECIARRSFGPRCDNRPLGWCPR